MFKRVPFPRLPRVFATGFGADTNRGDRASNRPDTSASTDGSNINGKASKADGGAHATAPGKRRRSRLAWVFGGMQGNQTDDDDGHDDEWDLSEGPLGRLRARSEAGERDGHRNGGRRRRGDFTGEGGAEGGGAETEEEEDDGYDGVPQHDKPIG